MVYQIYPRSFADGTGDGIGDLPGITSRVPYLRSLGVDAVWLSPFYPSALADGGYDIDDHRDVDPRLGSLDDFDAMVCALHAADIKVIIDIVPNHTSNRHRWFRQALAAAAPRNVSATSSGTVMEVASNRRTTGNRSLADRHGHQPAMASGTSTVLRPSSRISTGRTRRCGQTSGTPCASGPTGGRRIPDRRRPRPSQGHVGAVSAVGEIADIMRPDGSHPLWDRDDVHEIYAEGGGSSIPTTRPVTR